MLLALLLPSCTDPTAAPPLDPLTEPLPDPAPWATDLVANGDFERGDLTGWTVETGTCTIADSDDLSWIAAYEGDYMLHGGIDTTVDCLVSQEFDLLALGMSAEDLDSGRAAVDALAVLAHKSSDRLSVTPLKDDRTMLRVLYLSDAREELGSLRTLLSQDDKWAVRGVMGVLPEGTRKVRVEGFDGRSRQHDGISLTDTSPVCTSDPG